LRGYPPSVVARLGGFDPESLRQNLGLADLDRVPVRRAPRWMVRTWRGDVAAMTLPWGIYVRPETLGGDPARLAKLLSHELVHVRQWRELGTIGFLRRYLGDYWSGRRKGLGHNEAYLAIRFEREAREIISTLGR
jgi:hypothetical protein